MPLEFIAIGITLAGSGLTGAAIWGAARSRLNRAEADVIGVKADLVKHTADDVEQHTDIVQRLTRMETLLEGIDKRI